MVTDDPIIQDLQTLYTGGLGQCGMYGDAGSETVIHWAHALETSKTTILNRVANEIAKGYLAGSVEWEFGHWVANKVLFCGVTELNLDGGPVEEPAIWWAVYLAFDDSELSQSRQRLRDELQQAIER